MYPYFILLMLPSLGALLSRKRWHRFGVVLVFLAYFLFIGLRDQVGADWWGYIFMHRTVARMTLEQIFSKPEPFSSLLFQISWSEGGDMLISNMFAAFLLMFGVFSFANTTAAPWLAVVSATPYLVVAFGMTGIRQAMGVGLVLYAFSKWARWGAVRKSVLILIGAMFHSSALFGGLFIFPSVPMQKTTKIILLPLAASLVFFIAQSAPVVSTSLSVYGSRYTGSESVSSIGSVFHILLVALPAALAAYYRRKIKDFVPFNDLLYYGIIGTIAVTLFNFVSTTGASRLTLYLYFVPMMTYPALTCMFKPRDQKIVSLMIVVFHFIILFLWLEYANHSEAWLPYRSILF